MNVYISIGAQCTTATLFDRLHVKKETLPFDWIVSTPEFVYTILNLLLIDEKEISDIVDNHFFVCDKTATFLEVEHFVLNENGAVLVNSKYNVCFPHDTIDDRDKYIRRMERLKKIILDKDNFIHFVYVSVSSPTDGNYTLDGIEPIKNIYEYIEKINSIIKKIRSNYRIFVFDTNKPSDCQPSDDLHIKYYDINKRKIWTELMPELCCICNDLIDTVECLN